MYSCVQMTRQTRVRTNIFVKTHVAYVFIVYLTFLADSLIAEALLMSLMSVILKSILPGTRKGPLRGRRPSSED